MMQQIEMDFVIFSFSNWVVFEEEEDQMAQKGLTPLKRAVARWWMVERSVRADGQKARLQIMTAPAPVLAAVSFSESPPPAPPLFVLACTLHHSDSLDSSIEEAQFTAPTTLTSAIVAL